MATLGELLVRVNADVTGLQRGLDRATSGIRRFNAEMQSVGRTISLAVTLPIVALGATTVQAAAQMDSLRRGLAAVAGSSKAAEEQLVRLEDVAKLPGLGFREAIQGSIRLQAAGLNVALTERALRSFGNAIALTGGGKQQLDTITTQLGQLAAKGKVLGSDLRPIIEAAPAVGEALRKAFGTVDPEQIQKLHLSTDRFLTLLLNQLDKLPHVTGGAANSFENLEDAIFKARVAIGEKLLPAIVPLVEGIAKMLEGVRTLSPQVVNWGIAIAAVAAVAGPLIIVISALASAATALAAALAVGLLPVIVVGGPILIALGALSAMFVKNKLDALQAAGALDRYKASLIGLSEGQLIVNRNALTLDLMDNRASQAALRASGGDRTRIQGNAGIFGSGVGFGAPRPRVVESVAMATLGREANDATAKVHALDAALTALHATKATPNTPLVPTGSGKRDPLAGLLDGLTDRLRELQQLQKFGVASLSFLPDNVQEQIRLANSLAGELDTLEDGLRRFQAAGRAPPAGLTFGINALREQLAAASREVDNLATKMAGDKLRGRTNFVLPSINAATATSSILPQASGGSLVGVPETIGAFKGALLVAREALTQFGRSAFGAGASQLKGATDALLNMVGGFTPAGLAAAALSSALESLRPFIDALLVPVKIFGEILAISLVPVLRLLFPIIKAVAIVFSYLQEGVDRVLGGILWAAGGFIKGIGKLINAITPFANPGNPLVKAGQAIQDAGQGFTDAAKEIAKKRKELEGLSFDDALKKTTDAANKLTESMLNAVQGFKIAGFRFNAMEGRTVSSPAASASMSASASPSLSIGAVHLYAQPGEDVEDLWRRLKAVIQRESRSNTAMRPLAAMTV